MEHSVIKTHHKNSSAFDLYGLLIKSPLLKEAAILSILHSVNQHGQ